jgi:hypothetical protein
MARGRRRKTGKREPNGRVQRPAGAQVEQAATHVAKEARARLYGVAMADAGHSKLGSAVGRLRHAGAITEDQYDAAVAYARLHAQHLAAIDAPGRPIEPRSEDDPPRPCPDCGATIRCASCAEDWSDRIRWQWTAVNALLTVYERALLSQVVIHDLDYPAASRATARALDVVGSYFNQWRLAA